MLFNDLYHAIFKNIKLVYNVKEDLGVGNRRSIIKAITLKNVLFQGIIDLNCSPNFYLGHVMDLNNITDCLFEINCTANPQDQAIINALEPFIHHLRSLN